MKKRISGREMTKKTVLIAVMTALTAAVTFLVRIPTVATEGYVNPGDAVLLFAGVALGPEAGFFAGGLGSCLADIAAGYAHWAVPTLIIKGIEGMTAGFLFKLFYRIKVNRFLAAVLSVAPSAIIMAAGYLFASAAMKGSFAVAVVDLPGNCLQGLFGVAVCLLILIATSKIPGFASLVGFSDFYANDVAKRKVSATENHRSEPYTEISEGNAREEEKDVNASDDSRK